MTIGSELAKYIGNEMIKTGGKELAKAGTTSALSSIVPGMAGKIGSELATKSGMSVANSALSNLIPTKATKSPDIDKYLGGRLLDDSGKPMTFYHSTPNDFSKFDDSMLGKNTGYSNTSLGHFVTNDKDFSKRFIDIDNVGKTGRTMELQAKISNPITHPYMAGKKYGDIELDNIVKGYLEATDNQELLDELMSYADENGSSLYDEYMDMTFGGDDPFEFSGDERELLKNKGYDAVEIVEGTKNELVDGSKSNDIVSSYAVLDGNNLRPVRHIPVQQDNIPLSNQTSANNLVPSIRTNWNGAGDIEGMLDGKFLRTNDNYFPSVFSEGALGRATYGADQPIDQRKVAGLVRAIKNNEDIAPIAGFKNNDGLIDIYDGHHRLAAYRKAGKMPRVKLFDRASKEDAYNYADEWAKNAAKQVEKYLPAKPEAGLDEYGMGTIDLRDPNTPKATSNFSDSKIKDKRGNLLKLYHGTDSDFSEFGDVKTEPGYWFTEDKSYALSHGKNLKTVNLNMVKPLDVTTVDGDNKMWEYAKDCFGRENISEDDILSNKFRDYLMKMGYDGMIFDHSGKNTYIAFYPEQIKMLDK